MNVKNHISALIYKNPFLDAKEGVGLQIADCSRAASVPKFVAAAGHELTLKETVAVRK